MPLETPNNDLIGMLEHVAVESCLAWEAWPRIEVCRKPGLLWIASDVPFPLFNCVLKARLTGEDAGLQIDGIQAEAAFRGVPISWYVTPLSRPANLGELLLERGFAFDGGAAAFAGTIPEIEMEEVPGLSIARVMDREALFGWCSVLTAAFGFPPTVGHSWFEMHEAVGFIGGWRHYLALLDGQPVGASSLFAGKKMALVANVAVLSKARRKGIGTALTVAALRDARSLGQDQAAIFSSEMGEGVYRRLGFEEVVCRMNLYIWAGGDSPRIVPSPRLGQEPHRCCEL
ncbi:MAG: GNAT family N-acetyltransferase [Methanotrichaceae archaeon]|nr:GNAT family N-acetyltransferase [Methanotrichaceae archaeon]